MKGKNILYIFFLAVVLYSCNNSPKNVFKIAVASSYDLSHFGQEQLLSIFSRPALKFDSTRKDMVKTTYQAIIQQDIAYNQQKLNAVNALKVNEDAVKMLNASKDLYTFVLNKESKNYLDIAKMKDNGMADSTIREEIYKFWSKDQKTFEDKYDLLWGYGKMYADLHRIDINTQSAQH